MIDLINYISYNIILKQFVQNNNTLAVRKELKWQNDSTNSPSTSPEMQQAFVSLYMFICLIIVGMCSTKMNNNVIQSHYKLCCITTVMALYLTDDNIFI